MQGVNELQAAVGVLVLVLVLGGSALVLQTIHRFS